MEFFVIHLQRISAQLLPLSQRIAVSSLVLYSPHTMRIQNRTIQDSQNPVVIILDQRRQIRIYVEQGLQ